MNKQTLFLILISLFFSPLSGQLKTYDKALKSFETGNLKGAEKLIEKCLVHEETKDNPNVYLLKSKIQYAISKDASLSVKFPSAMKDALKYAEKSLQMQKNENAANTFRLLHSEYFLTLVKQNNKEALENFNLKKYAKALPMFRKSVFFGLDTLSMVYAAECLWYMDERSQSLPLYKRSAEIIYGAVLDSTTKVYGYQKEPFRKLCLYYMDYKQFDSAYLYVKNGREIFPNDPVLNTYTYALMRHTLDKIPPSIDYLRTVQNALRDFPSDSFLNHRENSIYIFLLNNYALENDQVNFDSTLSSYAGSKYSKRKHKHLETIKRFDIFAGQNSDVFIPELRNYLASIGLKEATYATWLCELRRRNNTYVPTEKDINDLTASENNCKSVSYIIDRHITLYPGNKSFINARAAYLNYRNSGKIALTYENLLPVIRMNDAAAKDFPKNPSYSNSAKAYRLRLLSETSDSGDFRLFRETWKETFRMYKDQGKTLDQLWRGMVENDFRKNYYGSRVNLKGKTEAGVPEYQWNGNADSCKWGDMPENIIGRAESRINYFRRMAGLSEEIILTNDDNEFCMYAALMCEANKSMSHEPSEGWRCFIPAGLDALKTSILSKDGNPLIAITAAMGQNHPTAGNRRWLLYPNAMYMGIGSSRSYTAIRAVDNSQNLDTNKYRKNFISWPPERDCPKMLVFKKWSFTLDQNLEAATVDMTDASGNKIELKLEAVVNGYGMNTLVWEPEINIQTVPDNTEYTVRIRLKNGATFQYTVRIIDIRLNK